MVGSCTAAATATTIDATAADGNRLHLEKISNTQISQILLVRRGAASHTMPHEGVKEI